MSDHQKANYVARSGEFGGLSVSAEFIDGTPLGPESGGVVRDGGQLYSVARADMVPCTPSSEIKDNRWVIPSNRIGKIAMLNGSKMRPTTYGAELEYVRLDGEDGNYADLTSKELTRVKELYTFMGEGGTKATDDQNEFENQVWGMIHDEVDSAENAGHRVAALAVFGQNEPSNEKLNPDPYVVNVAGQMRKRTGFDPIKLFRVGSAQPHTGGSNTKALKLAAEAMEYLSPVLQSPTLSGPLLHGGIAGNLDNTRLNARQREHLLRVGVNESDFEGDYLSWRYLLRRIGSPSAGIWLTPPAEESDDYYKDGHEKLANGEINNIDRANGWHANRLRVVLDESGNITLEASADDPMLGNPDAIIPQNFLRAALTTRFEQMALKGKDPREAVARMLGIDSLSRQERLDRAHHISLRKVSREGNDAKTYRNFTPGEWLPTLLQIAHEAPYTRISDEHELRLRKMYANNADTRSELNQWCEDNHTNSPTARAYFELGINNPAIYMREHFKELRRQSPEKPAEIHIREVELFAARALHQTSHEKRAA